MTDGEKMVLAAAFAMVAANPEHDNKQSKEVAAIAGATADEALRLLRFRAEYDADARAVIGKQIPVDTHRRSGQRTSSVTSAAVS